MSEQNWFEQHARIRRHAPVDLERLLDAALAPEPHSNALAAKILQRLSENRPTADAEFTALLDSALAPPTPPPHLVQRILDATSDQVPTPLARQLDDALAPEAVDPGLERRIEAALSSQGQAAGIGTAELSEAEVVTAGGRRLEAPDIAGRVDGRSAPSAPGSHSQFRLADSWRYVAAAAVLIVYGAGLWMSLAPPKAPDRTVADEDRAGAAEAVSFARVQQRVDQVFDQAEFAALGDRYDREMEQLTWEIEWMLGQVLVEGLFQPDEIDYDVQFGFESDATEGDEPADLF